MSGAAVERYLRLKQELIDLALRAGRKPDDVRLIAASKTHGPEELTPLIDTGLVDFGENTVQEALPKIDRLRTHTLTWHFIGHLQSNKAKRVPGNFAWLHSLDSLALAQRLETFLEPDAGRLQTLIEVNVTGDVRKHGIPPDRLQPFIESLRGLPHLRLRGLMTIGPYPASADAKRACFANLRELCETLRARFDLPEFDQLSMGMSGDYVEAVAEGATMVRIGTAIFGERDYRRR